LSSLSPREVRNQSDRLPAEASVWKHKHELYFIVSSAGPFCKHPAHVRFWGKWLDLTLDLIRVLSVVFRWFCTGQWNLQISPAWVLSDITSSKDSKSETHQKSTQTTNAASWIIVAVHGNRPLHCLSPHLKNSNPGRISSGLYRCPLLLLIILDSTTESEFDSDDENVQRN
jgi:hypothetical protein